MNTNQLHGKLEQVQGDAKIWLGSVSHNPKLKLEGKLDKTNGKLIEQKGNALAQYEKAKKTIENKLEEVQTKAQKNWDKLNKEDLNELNNSFEKFGDKIKEKYNHSQEVVDSQIREFMKQF